MCIWNFYECNGHKLQTARVPRIICLEMTSKRKKKISWPEATKICQQQKAHTPAEWKKKKNQTFIFWGDLELPNFRWYRYSSLMENTSKETTTTETEKPGAEASSLKGEDAKRKAKASMQVGKTAILILIIIIMLSGNHGRDNSAKCSSSPCSGGKFFTAI